jgi:hypothetical protein
MEGHTTGYYFLSIACFMFQQQRIVSPSQNCTMITSAASNVVMASSTTFLNSSTSIYSFSRSLDDNSSLFLRPLSQGSIFHPGGSSVLSSATWSASLSPLNSQVLFNHNHLDETPLSEPTAAVPFSSTITLGKCVENDSSFPTLHNPRIFEDSPSSLQKLLETLKRTPWVGVATTQPLSHTQTKTEEPCDDKEKEDEEKDTSITSPSKSNPDKTQIVPDTHIKFGRGTGIYDWHGNIMFRDLVKTRQEEYKNFGDTRNQKTALSKAILDTLRNDGVYFWDRKKGSKEWYMLDYDVHSNKIREKVSSALRSPYDDTGYYSDKRERFEQKKKGRAVRG